MKLTKKQEEVLLLIKQNCIDYGYFPSLSEVARQYKTTKQNMSQFFDSLVQKGYLSNNYRGIYLLTREGKRYK